MNMNNPPRSKVSAVVSPSAPASASPSHSCGGPSALPPRSKVSEAGDTSPSASSPRSKVPAPVSKRTAPTAKVLKSSVPEVNPYEETYIANCRKYVEASNAYYIDSNPIMDDSDFDKLAIDISSMLALHPELAKFGNPLASIQSDHVDGFQKVAHSYPMLSLDDIYTEDELTKFIENTRNVGATEWIAEWKYDGLSLSLIYEQGKLVRAVTRGDGTQGDDVTAQAKCIPSIPHTLKGEIDIEVRGEVFMPKFMFEIWNKEHPNDKFANPRNAASGTLKSHDPNKCYERGLMFVAYYADYNSLGVRQNEILYALSQLGFNSPYENHCFCTDKIEALVDYIVKFGATRDECDIPTDGVVIKVNKRGLWDTLGYTDRFYRWGVAFKFKQESLRSRLLQVSWQLAESGRVTPVAIYEPIQMFGTTCQRATLNNPQWIEQNLPDIRIGDTLLLTKGGEIIPKVTGFIPHELTQHEKNMELVTPRQWTEAIGSPVIAQTFGKVVPPDMVNGKGTYRNGAYLQVDVDPKPTDGAPTKRVNESPKVTGSSLRGKTILVSGNFGTPQIRKDIERTVVEQGGTLANGVTLSVDYYVLPDNLDDWKHKAGSKWTKIQSYMHQSRIITKDQFYSLIH